MKKLMDVKLDPDLEAFIDKKEEGLQNKKDKKRKLDKEFYCELCVSQSFQQEEDLVTDMRVEHDVSTLPKVIMRLVSKYDVF